MPEHSDVYVQCLLSKYGLSDQQWTQRVELARKHLMERGEECDLSAVLARHEMERLDLELKQRAEIAAFDDEDSR